MRRITIGIVGSAEISQWPWCSDLFVIIIKWCGNGYVGTNAHPASNVSAATSSSSFIVFGGFTASSSDPPSSILSSVAVVTSQSNFFIGHVKPRHFVIVAATSQRNVTFYIDECRCCRRGCIGCIATAIWH